ncbi:AAA-like domain-containing protein [Candidatus Leptofilum sp.]|uniref:AAA-like domain-containing protein n=1 Tax=Candidatus Leptofilum sp. TaxID=3241576 RepID=UPI003B594EF5
MMRIQPEMNGRRQQMSRTQTGPFKNELLEAKAALITAVLSGKSCYVQGENAPLRYRLLTDTALRLTDLGQTAAYFDLIDLDYQYDFARWMHNSLRLLAIQLNVPLPEGDWWTTHSTDDPAAAFVQFLEEKVLPQVKTPILLSFDEADQLLRAPLAADFWQLLRKIESARLQQPLFKNLVVVLWGTVSWEKLADDGRFPIAVLKPIIL